jgi:hypothetical protein
MSILGAQSGYNGVERIVPAFVTVLAYRVGSVAQAILRCVRPLGRAVAAWSRQ